MEAINDKIIALESYIAYVENFTEELNKVVIQQGEAIKTLTKEINHLKEKLENQGETPGFEKPPHY